MKEYTDAEGLMSLPTSDFHKPTVCLGRQKQSLTNNDANAAARSIAATITAAAISANPGTDRSTCNIHEFSTITLPLETPLKLVGSIDRTNGQNMLVQHSYNNSGDLTSVDSSDTYASCQTHPFLSQGDLTGEMADITCTLAELDVDDLYFMTLDKDQPSTIDGKGKVQVKKSASGDASLHSLGAPIEDVFKTFQTFEMASRIERGSHISLNEAPIPKHRKTRFQQSSLNKGKVIKGNFEASTSSKKQHSQDSLIEPQTSVSHPSSMKKIRRSSFMPSKSLASATKLINQHLFGIQNANIKGEIKPQKGGFKKKKKKNSNPRVFHCLFFFCYLNAEIR